MSEIKEKICKKCLICKDIDQFYTNGKYRRNTCSDCEKKQKNKYRENNKEKIDIKNKKYKENNKDKIKEKGKIYYANNKDKIKKRSNNYRSENQDIIKERKKVYYENNKYKISKKSKEYRENNKDYIKENGKIYYANNKDKIKEYNKKYYENNKENLNIQNKEYYENNKKQIKIYQNEYIKERRKIDPIFVLRSQFSNLFNKNIKNVGLFKNGNSCFDILDYTFEEFLYNMESKFEYWMNWNNYGKYDPKLWDNNNSNTWKWNLDHIIPQSELPYKDFNHENFKKCWKLDNLRPYSAKQNLLDGATRIRHKK